MSIDYIYKYIRTVSVQTVSVDGCPAGNVGAIFVPAERGGWAGGCRLTRQVGPCILRNPALSPGPRKRCICGRVCRRILQICHFTYTTEVIKAINLLC